MSAPVTAINTTTPINTQVILVLDDEAFLRVRLEDASDAHVTLGWELERRRGVWLTSRWYWHDFRPEFHPGIGEEEWTRICG